MKRQKLIKHLLINNCALEREGANHSWYKNIKTGYRSAVPRHTEISDILASIICKQLGIPKIKNESKK